MAQTKKCKFCQSEIDKKAKVCPVCKRTLKGHGCLVSILVFIIICCGSIVFALQMDSFTQKSISGVDNESEYITLEEYNQIETGMTYEQVVEIIGSSGTLSTESNVADINTKIYTWYGNGSAGSNANVTFVNNSVQIKGQVGLK